ncbi:MAG: alpha/beta hydrolase [Myxococcales bacterium]|nr:lysophospholipase [Myxococcota bacterium]MDW8283494.1 alpha/beta hydrolase [Myxococcales bacterium]
MTIRRYFSSDRTPLCADLYEPDPPVLGSPPPQICVVHGYCDHRGRYRDMASRLQQAGYRVLVPDLRGHGEAGGARAHVVRFGDYLEDLHATLTTCAEQGAMFLLGHSMGGLVVLLYALDRPERVRGLALSSPLFGLKVKVPVWKKALGRIASRIHPALALPNELDPADLSHDPAVGQAYASDPLVSRIATARWFTEMMAAQAAARRRVRSLRTPLLLMHGGDDRIADPVASQALFDRVGERDKVLLIYPGLYHEIFNERDRDMVIQDLVSWLNAH